MNFEANKKQHSTKISVSDSVT